MTEYGGWRTKPYQTAWEAARVVTGSDDQVICDVFGEYELDCTGANKRARLIAATPKLLAVLKILRSMVGAPHDFTIGDIWNAQKRADEVIAEAEKAMG